MAITPQMIEAFEATRELGVWDMHNGEALEAANYYHDLDMDIGQWAMMLTMSEAVNIKNRDNE